MANKNRDFDFEVKEVTPAGNFTGYGSVYGNIDQGGDIVSPGAFAESLVTWQQKGRLPAMLFGHQAGELPVGTYQKITENPAGLWLEGNLAIDTQKGGDLHKLMKIGAISGLSIGFRTRDDAYDQVTGIRTIKKADLYEISIVNMPMNDSARVVSVKGMSMTDREFEQLMQDAGFSRKESREIMNHGFRSFAAMQDAGADWQKSTLEKLKSIHAQSKQR